MEKNSLFARLKAQVADEVRKRRNVSPYEVIPFAKIAKSPKVQQPRSCEKRRFISELVKFVILTQIYRKSASSVAFEEANRPISSVSEPPSQRTAQSGNRPSEAARRPRTSASGWNSLQSVHVRPYANTDFRAGLRTVASTKSECEIVRS